MKDKTKRRYVMVTAIGVVFLIVTSVFISMEKFSTPNSVLVVSGLIKVMFTQSEVVQIQDYPAVFLAKPDNAQQRLIDFMTKQGYRHLAEERLSSMFVFENDVTRRYVDFSLNGYYSKWVFKGHL